MAAHVSAALLIARVKAWRTCMCVRMCAHIRVYIWQGDDRALSQFSCPLRNWVMSRHVAGLYSPIKSISGFGGCLFLPLSAAPYIIPEESSTHRRSRSRFTVVILGRDLAKDLIYRGFSIFSISSTRYRSPRTRLPNSSRTQEKHNLTTSLR